MSCGYSSKLILSVFKEIELERKHKMRRRGWKVLFLAVGVLFIAAFAGCNEDSLSETRKSRLIASENRQLKKEVKSRKEQAERCLQEKKASEEDMQSMSEYLIGEIKKLREENEGLKGQIERLQTEVKGL